MHGNEMINLDRTTAMRRPSQALVAFNNWDLPSRTKLPSGGQRPAAGLPAISLPPGGSDHFRSWGSSEAPLLVISDLGVLFGLWPQVSALTAIGALPIALWEFSLGVWLVVKGFKPSPITDGIPRRSPARR
jgi:hypothetical protein